MTNLTICELLENHGACEGGREWAEEYPSPAAAWEACPRSDWLLWALAKLGQRDNVKDRIFACRCVRETPLRDGRTVWDLLGDPRSRAAVEVAERFTRGEAPLQELAAAEAAARAAAQAAAWAAAWAAAEAAEDAAGAADWAAAAKRQADILREIHPNPFAEAKP
jgi:hypothetical protein